MHPIHTLVASEAGGWMRYDPIEHCLVGIPESATSVAAVRQAAAELVDPGGAVLLALVAEPGKTAAKYERAESLVWRDAGVVLGYMSIVAEALQLAFCPLGLTGHPHTLEPWAAPGQLRSVALALLGRRRET